MSNKTINQALKDLYTGLGGDPQALTDNSTCSDYIEDLESAIKGAASGAQIDDTTPSETKVYSSAKTEELINSIEALPSVTSEDIGEALIVESDGEGGAQWGKGVIPQNVVVFSATITGSTLKLSNSKTGSDIFSVINGGGYPIIIEPLVGYFLPSAMQTSTYQFANHSIVNNGGTVEDRIRVVSVTNDSANTFNMSDLTLKSAT